MTIEEIRTILAEVSYAGYRFEVEDRGAGTILLSAAYEEPDIDSREPALQRTRKWFLSPHSTRGEVVQTALKCVLTSMEHRVREHFTYGGRRIFHPHWRLEALVDAYDHSVPEYRE